jgi:hypothetical protein
VRVSTGAWLSAALTSHAFEHGCGREFCASAAKRFVERPEFALEVVEVVAVGQLIQECGAEICAVHLLLEELGDEAAAGEKIGL